MTVQEQHRISRRGAASLIVAVMTIAAFSLWTVIPYGWVWIGSQLSKGQEPAGGPYMVTFFGIVASILLVAFLIGRLNRLYVHLTGTNEMARMRLSIFRSMRDSTKPRSMTVVEFVVVTSVVMAILAATIWFFILAGSPLPNQ